MRPVWTKERVGFVMNVEDHVSGWYIRLRHMSSSSTTINHQLTAASPSPLRAIRSPSSVPGWIWNSTRFFSLVTLVPLHFLHLHSQLVHGSSLRLLTFPCPVIESPLHDNPYK